MLHVQIDLKEKGTLEQTLHRRYMNKHIKRFSASLVIRQMHIKAIMRYDFTPTDNIKRLTILNIGRREQLELIQC